MSSGIITVHSTQHTQYVRKSLKDIFMHLMSRKKEKKKLIKESLNLGNKDIQTLLGLQKHYLFTHEATMS